MIAILQFRRSLHVSLALLVVGASLHCAWEWQTSIKQMASATAYQRAGLPLPIGWPHPGCNESGCICRGATIAQAVDFADLHAVAGQWLPAAAELAPSPRYHSAASGEFLLHGDHCLFAPPISGRQLRALYVSLVI